MAPPMFRPGKTAKKIKLNIRILSIHLTMASIYLFQSINIFIRHLRLSVYIYT
jgi:hypothetical protein